MATPHHERVTKGLSLLQAGLRPFVERELQSRYGKDWAFEVKELLADTRLGGGKGNGLHDVAALLVVMDRRWTDVFKRTLGRAERTFVNELIDVRNRWAHQEAFSGDDADRALDSMYRLLTAVSASKEADDVNKMKQELRRQIYEDQSRAERRKTTSTIIETGVAGGLKPWREVVSPHRDVASGRYQQAEFAADLWQVHIGEGSDEYKNPAEFFRRTYLTESLKGLLVGAIRRVSGQGGDPVVQLQTNFGGGKTHSMLALYHLLSGTTPAELTGVDAVMKQAEATKLPKVNRVVLVGNKVSPGNPVTKPDGTVVRTLWGELAWQLGGKKAYQRVKQDDERATNPGDVLRTLFNEYGPCLVLIDEWVAYARQLHDQGDLPAGSFETQFTFAQALTEAARGVKNCLLVISLPASDTGASPSTQMDDVEVGGERGRAALSRLQNVVGRVESSWRPATAEEGFEIVRRRLFEPLVEKTQYTARDNVARAFYDFYRGQAQDFPQDARDADYEKRLRAAYPIHPEVFDRLYTDWSTLIKFQRTRGVLRLMAAVIHCLWEKDDRNPLILPANIPIDDPRVQFELTRYLSDHWTPIIEKDVDGPQSLPLQIDREVTNLGKFSACRRVARTIYLGSAPIQGAANRGIEDRRIKLGCVMPGESSGIFDDALRRLARAATYLYQDGPRYWYSTQPTVTKLAEDRAAQLVRDPDKVHAELEARLKVDLAQRGDFARVHVLPQSGADVQDDLAARLVVLGPEEAYAKEANCPAEVAARNLLDSRGNAPRLFRNTLVFLAMDRARWQELDDALRRYLAWASIVDDKETLNLDPHQVKQAETQCEAATKTVNVRLPEAYQSLLVPHQSTPQSAIEWQALRLAGQDPLAVRASKRLRNEELLITRFAGTRLRMELDKIPLWRGDHVELRQLVDDFARYPYLPRLAGPTVLVEAVQDGVSQLTWERDAFAFADSFDERERRYRGLRGGQQIALSADSSGFVVKTDVARRQLDQEVVVPPSPPVAPGSASGREEENNRGKSGAPSPPRQARRYFGTVHLDAARVGRDAAKVADEVISHLSGLVGADVRVTLEIEASVPSGVPDTVVRIVTENGKTLKFTSQGFEQE